MNEIELTEEQVEKFMLEGKVCDLAKLSDESFGVVICRIHADRMMQPAEQPIFPVDTPER